MKYIKKLAVSAIIIIFAITVIIFSEEASASVVNSINVCLNVIIPSMFIFMVISSYILSSGLYKIIFSPLYTILKGLIRLDKELMSVFLLSLIGGYPVGIKLLKELISQNKNYSEIADKASSFSYCISPTFAVTMIGLELYNSIEAGLIVYISNVVSCIITAIIFSRIYKLRTDEKANCNRKNAGIIEAVNSSAVTLMKICAIIVFFNTAITAAECIFQKMDIVFPNYIKSILEISNVLRADKISIASLPFISALSSFGGICVIFQCISMINGAFSVKIFVISRIFTTLLSYAVTKIMLLFWDISVSVNTGASDYIFHFSADKAAAVFLLIMCVILMQKSEKIFKKG